jgi:recombination protein RecT
MTKPAENSMAVRVNTIGDLLNERKSQIAQALPSHLDAGRMIRVFMTSIQKNPKLADCTLASLYSAVLQSSQLGLEIDGVMGHAYIIPYKINGVMTASFQPGYRGLCELARRSGEIGKIWARVVYIKDEFEFQLGTTEFVKHIPCGDNDPGKVRLVYACAEFKDGSSPALRILFPRDITKRRNASKSAHQSSSPWHMWEEEMTLKTGIIALSRTLPASAEMATATGLAEIEHQAPVYPHLDIDPNVLDALDASDAARTPKTVTAAAQPAASKPKRGRPPGKTTKKTTPPEAAESPEGGDDDGNDPDLSLF